MNIQFKDSSTETGLETLRDPRGIILFGAGGAGKLARTACANAGIRVAVICDTDPAKQSTVQDGIPVVSPRDAVTNWAGRPVLVAVSGAAVLDNMVGQLASLGVGECYGLQFLDRYYRFDGTPGFANHGHEANQTAKLAGILHRRYPFGGEKIVAFNPAIYITDNCTLNCRDCGSFMPAFSRAENFPLAEIYRNIDALCACVDEIINLGILGGEPLMHPGFHLAVRHAASREQVKGITIYTNGTLIPRAAQWADLSHPKVFLAVSDYGELSRSKDELAEECERHGVRGMLRQWHDWFGYMAQSPEGRTGEALRQHVRSCVSKCCVVSNQRLYPCGTMLNGIRLGWFPDTADDSINMAPALDGGDVAAVRAEMRHFLYEKDSFQACDYCKGGGIGREVVPAAIQAPRAFE